eukprot:CAMPEP_0196724444 /NCGR_PEP_ID=MMETSP1091-20130531/6289_1 /TAXON_ID=302021 /ORGANISM="Rhodomonas sp., Strain CCMP768" /LENGTH=150 /DNA_ID=CAMNT_0042066559 /DNA_START=243 /DNA_END=695 /DNA_ORIENTATION=-
MMYSDRVSHVMVDNRKRDSNRQLLVGCSIVALGLCVMVLAIGEQDAQEEDSVHNLLAATKVSVTGKARQQALYDQGMEDEAAKQMRIAYATFLKGKDENTVGEYKSLNATLTDEQNALWDYADEMKAIETEVEAEAKQHKDEYSPKQPSE